MGRLCAQPCARSWGAKALPQPGVAQRGAETQSGEASQCQAWALLDSGQEGPGSGAPRLVSLCMATFQTPPSQKRGSCHIPALDRELPKEAGGWNRWGTYRSLPAPGKLLRL